MRLRRTGLKILGLHTRLKTGVEHRRIIRSVCRRGRFDAARQRIQSDCRQEVSKGRNRVRPRRAQIDIAAEGSRESSGLRSKTF